MATGNWSFHLYDFFLTMNSSGLSSTSLSSKESKIGKLWLSALEKNIFESGA